MDSILMLEYFKTMQTSKDIESSDDRWITICWIIVYWEIEKQIYKETRSFHLFRNRFYIGKCIIVIFLKGPHRIDKRAVREYWVLLLEVLLTLCVHNKPWVFYTFSKTILYLYFNKGINIYIRSTQMSYIFLIPSLFIFNTLYRLSINSTFALDIRSAEKV